MSWYNHPINHPSLEEQLLKSARHIVSFPLKLIQDGELIQQPCFNVVRQ